MLMTMYLALAAQSAQPVVIAPSAPLPIISTRIVPPPIIRSEPMPAIPIEVQVTAGDKLLYSDTLRVARNAGASYSESRSEASSAVCSDAMSYDRSERTSLNIQLNWRDFGNEAPAANITVNWQRPLNGAECASIGSRGVQLNQSVRLAPGESATIKGDAGLTVRLTRR